MVFPSYKSNLITIIGSEWPCIFSLTHWRAYMHTCTPAYTHPHADNLKRSAGPFITGWQKTVMTEWWKQMRKWNDVKTILKKKKKTDTAFPGDGPGLLLRLLTILTPRSSSLMRQWGEGWREARGDKRRWKKANTVKMNHVCKRKNREKKWEMKARETEDNLDDD